MKKLLSLLIICASLSYACAQSCDQLIYMNKGKVVKYASANAKGTVQTRMTYTVVTRAGTKSTVKSQVFDDKGKEISASESDMICSGNMLKLDMRSFIPASSAAQFKNMTMKADVSYINYPTSMQVGQTLEDGNFSMQMYNKDQKMADMAYKVTSRKVEGKETVTTPAGTFDCYKVSYAAEMKTTTFGMTIPFSMSITEWYAPKAGLYVKSEASSKNGKVISITTLESIN